MISKGDVVHIAKLARLELTEEEVEKIQKDLSSILDYFTVPQEAKKTGASVDSGLKQPVNIVRKDEALPKDLAKTLIDAAPDKKDGYIKVKQIL